jgi:hypothetical protein
VDVNSDDIGGVVTSAKGPEAGVWVIAETTDLPTKFRKIVVTDDAGRYLLPELPKAKYQIWVRGYGLVDSPHVQGVPGNQLNLTAVVAPNPRAAAQIYPANYWFSLIQVPPKSDFPGTGQTGNGINPKMRSQDDWISQMKSGCQTCHQLGTKATREIPESLGKFPSSVDAWNHRTAVGQDGASMIVGMDNLGRSRAAAMFADWTDRIAAGEVPPAPPRPKGIERNLVVTTWDWGGTASFVHDEMTTNKLKPTMNANGPYYGVDYTGNELLIVDPKTNSESRVKLAFGQEVPYAKPQSMPQPSPYWGDEIYWTGKVQSGYAVMDDAGRVWITHVFRAPDNPAYCQQGSNNPFAKNYPLATAGKQLSVYDPETKKDTLIDVCARIHHMVFSGDQDRTIYYTSNRDAAIGWIKTRVWDETHDAQKAEGWCPLVIDYNGDGVTGKWTEPGETRNPKLDVRLKADPYGINVSPLDGSVWIGSPGTPGMILRFQAGSNPPFTCKTEAYQPPFNNPKASARNGYVPRGIDIDGNGVVWTALAGSGQFASFDRRKCKGPLIGPTATGQHCPEGWTLYNDPGPTFKGTDVSTEYHYGNWVDRYDALGLGRNVPISLGTVSDSLLVLLPSGEWVRLRVPYPLGLFMRSMDGRIDDPNAGWKGRGVYADYGGNADWHIEGGKGTRSAIVKFQLRPDPLAK